MSLSLSTLDKEAPSEGCLLDPNFVQLPVGVSANKPYVHLKRTVTSLVMELPANEAAFSCPGRITNGKISRWMCVKKVSEHVEGLRTAIKRARPKQANFHPIGRRCQQGSRIAVTYRRRYALDDRVGHSVHGHGLLDLSPGWRQHAADKKEKHRKAQRDHKHGTDNRRRMGRPLKIIFLRNKKYAGPPNGPLGGGCSLDCPISETRASSLTPTSLGHSDETAERGQS